MQTSNNLPMAVNAQILAVDNDPEAAVGDEIETAGLALGDLIERGGGAIAEAQNKLNAISAATATALATTRVDVIAAQETEYDDQGNFIESRTHTRELPLINFIDPVFYQWDMVRLQGNFVAREFVDNQTATNKKYSSGFNAGLGGSGGVSAILAPFRMVTGRFGVSSSLGGRTSTTTTTTSSDLNSDISYGSMRMNALLKPRDDVSVPKPRQVIRGPRIQMIEGEIQDIFDGEAGVISERTMTLSMLYTRKDGAPIANKNIAIETDGASWASDSQTTDAEGLVTITLHRYFLEEGADTAPQSISVTARVGMVQNTNVVTF